MATATKKALTSAPAKPAPAKPVAAPAPANVVATPAVAAAKPKAVKPLVQFAVVEFNDGTEGAKDVAGIVTELGPKKSKVLVGDAEGVPKEIVTVANSSLTVIGKATKRNGNIVNRFLNPRPERDPNAPSKSLTAGADLSHYVRNMESKTPGGRPSFDINDETASILRGKNFADMITAVVKKIKQLTGEAPDPKVLAEKYGRLNAGQQRMNLGNRLRAAFRVSEKPEAEEAAE